jgi:hypothetical protein
MYRAVAVALVVGLATVGAGQAAAQVADSTGDEDGTAVEAEQPASGTAEEKEEHGEQKAVGGKEEKEKKEKAPKGSKSDPGEEGEDNQPASPPDAGLTDPAPTPDASKDPAAPTSATDPAPAPDASKDPAAPNSAVDSSAAGAPPTIPGTHTAPPPLSIRAVAGAGAATEAASRGQRALDTSAPTRTASRDRIGAGGALDRRAVAARSGSGHASFTIPTAPARRGGPLALALLLFSFALALVALGVGAIRLARRLVPATPPGRVRRRPVARPLREHAAPAQPPAVLRALRPAGASWISQLRRVAGN